MFERLSRRFARDERGFTLIELMVVVLIIAILIAIAIPTFLGARKRAQDRAAQSNIRNAFTAEKTYYTDAQVYADSTTGPGALTGIEPSLVFVATDPPTAVTGNNVSAVLSGATVFLAAKSASGTCFYLKDDATGATQYTKSTASPCDATGAVAGWSTIPW